MAIDTAAKRASCIGLALLALRPGIIPDGGNLAAAERLHVQGLYSGISASAAELPDGDVILVPVDDRTVAVSASDSTVLVPTDDRTVLCPVRPT